MASQHHDTGYKELFSHPEFVQQLVEGFAPPEIGRLLHYVACFYDHLLKSGAATAAKGLPPVLPMVLYNGARRWAARQDIYEMIQPEPPEFLRVYQPHLRYYLIDEGRYTNEQLATRDTPLSGVFGIENASRDLEALQQAVDRVVAIIRAGPNKERTDAIITRWLKRHLQRLGAGVELEQLNSVVEEKDMLAENWKYLGEKERLEGRLEGERRVLQRQLTRRFGELPAWVLQRLEAASAETLETWTDEILTASSLEELFGR